MRLRYTGLTPVTFTDPRVGERRPGDEFNLPDEDGTFFLARGDVSEVKTSPDPTLTTRVVMSLLSTPDVTDEPELEPGHEEPEPPVVDEVPDEPTVDETVTDHS